MGDFIKMSKITRVLILFVGIGTLFLAAGNPPDFENNWHQWRGPYMTGFSPNGDPPVEWGESINMKWKTPIPGKGHSTPVIWGEQIILTTAVAMAGTDSSMDRARGPQARRQGMPSGRQTSEIHQFIVMSIDRNNGKILWQRTVSEEVPEEATHEFGSWASNSAVTDGERIYAYFGSRGLYCLDMEGKLMWDRDFGQMSKRMEFGEGESVALYGERIIVNWDHEGESFIVALDRKTGRDIWKIDRDEGTSWATPCVVSVNGTPQVITAATNRVRSYDLDSGKLLWECAGLTANAIPTPFAAEGILYVMSGYRGNALLAIRLDGAKGDITGTDAIVWELDRDTSYAPSALLMGENLYFLRSNNGILSCFDAKTGEEHFSGERLEGMGNVFASPVGAKDRIYIAGQQGTFYVVKHGTEFEILAKNSIDDNFIASPVILGKQLFLRGYSNLYCIEE